jgi:amino acid permease
MSATKIVGWILCGVIGLLSLSIYLRMSLRVWLRNLRFESPPENVLQYLGKVALSVLGVCLAGYAALLIHDWRFLSWFMVFLLIAIVLLIFATGNLWWEIYWGRRSYQKLQQSGGDGHQGDEKEAVEEE